MSQHPARRRNVHLKKRKPEFQLKTWHKLVFLSPIFLIILLFKGNDWYRAYMLKANKDSTWATITKVTLTGVKDAFDTENVVYSYTVGDSIFTEHVSVPVNHRYVIGSLDLPLFPNQRYRVYYASNKPHISEINLSVPDSQTIRNYINEASYLIGQILSESSEERTKCIAQKIYDKFGYDGLAYIFFYDEYVVENFKHNSQTFKTFWNSNEVMQIISSCKVSNP
jgi:hypothetical protein